jgi:hypothetical protein
MTELLYTVAKCKKMANELNHFILSTRACHYRKQGKIPRLQLRNLFTKPTTICYIRRLTKEYPNEYKGDEYNLVHSSVTWNQ